MATDNLISVSVKWSKKPLPQVQIDTSEPPAVFKSQLWTLTGVPPDRQTIIGFKGGKLKDDSEWTDLKPKDGMKIILLGTPDESRLPPPTNMPNVHDDLDIDKNGETVEPPPTGPPGMVNLGNTCYMNATVQCLKNVPPLTDKLSQYRGSTTALNPAEKLAAGLRDVFSRLKSANSAKVNPTLFHQILRQVNPQFAERGENGFFMQQDAEECWSELLNRLATALEPSDNSTNPIDDLFAFEMSSQDRCTETEEVVNRTEKARALKCHISVNVSHLQDGIKEGLVETIDKTSEQLGRSVNWDRTSKINSLPPFLNLQFVRFFWKPAERVKAKILRRVSFPLTLDLYDFCSESLQEKLSTRRDANPLTESAAAAGNSSNAAPADAESCSGGSETGNYELCAVLTHKGRAADAGHYVAWVKQEDNKWYQFDDDKVTIHSEEDVEKLSGGGDWHMAYMCLYRAN